jgi:hypothetical protein
LAQILPFRVTDHVLLLQWNQRWGDTQARLTPETDPLTDQLRIPVSSARAPAGR